MIQTAIGGQTIATTVEGRERYPISVRYARDFRNDLDALKRVLVPLPALAETLNSPAGTLRRVKPADGSSRRISRSRWLQKSDTKWARHSSAAKMASW